MANGHGGYRKPANPHQVSGPGKYSKRTDGQSISTAPDQGYGDAKQQAADQRIAPMAGDKPLPAPADAAGAAQASAPVYTGGDFAGPSTMPDQPVTTGVDIGDGAGPEAMNLPAQPSGPQGTGYLTNLLSRLASTDATGILAQLGQMAEARNA